MWRVSTGTTLAVILSMMKSPPSIRSDSSDTGIPFSASLAPMGFLGTTILRKGHFAISRSSGGFLGHSPGKAQLIISVCSPWPKRAGFNTALRIGTVKKLEEFFRIDGPARVMIVGVAKESTETTASSESDIGVSVIWGIILRFLWYGKLRGRRPRKGADSNAHTRAFPFQRR